MRLKYSHRKITMTFTYFQTASRLPWVKKARSAEVGALAPAFEKSASDFKLRQKVLICKSAIHIVTFKVRTINKIVQLLEQRTSVVEHNIDMIYGEKTLIPS